MTDTINLSKRLKTIASFLPQATLFADIGSDHAYLPCYVCLQDKNAKAIAGEINEGPYKSAHETVTAYNLEDRIQVRLGDGLEVLEETSVKEVVIAGMGGSLIVKILNDGRQHLKQVERIIAQPNIGEKNVRKWFLENNYTVIEEIIIEENEHLYEIIVAEQGVKDNIYSKQILEKQLFFGPLLLSEKSPVFIKKWTLQKSKWQQVISQVKQASVQNKEKIKQFEQELRWIEEVLHDGSY